jgi:hypothetical protein
MKSLSLAVLLGVTSAKFNGITKYCERQGQYGWTVADGKCSAEYCGIKYRVRTEWLPRRPP